MSQTPDESAAAKEQNLKLSNQVVNIQNKDETKKVTEITGIHDKSSSASAEAILNVANARDDQARGGVRPARDSLGWSVVQMKDNTLGSKGEISRVRQFLTPDYDYGDNTMRNFAQTHSDDYHYSSNLMGEKG